MRNGLFIFMLAIFQNDCKNSLQQTATHYKEIKQCMVEKEISQLNRVILSNFLLQGSYCGLVSNEYSIQNSRIFFLKKFL